VLVDAFQTRENVCEATLKLGGKVLIQEDAQFGSVTVSPIRDICGKRVHSGEIVFLETWMFLQNLFLRHAMR